MEDIVEQLLIQTCWLCGHFQCDCHLNYNGPAQPCSGGLATTVNDDHQPQFNDSTTNLNTILCTEGFTNQSPTRFLLDSIAAVSVV